MADVIFTPTFHHVNWQDGIDRVEAGGPNGFNNRFNAIGADLNTLSTVVSQIDTAIEDFQAPSVSQLPRQLQLNFTPPLRPVPPNPAWTFDANGVPTSASTGSVGVANVNLPDQVRLTALRAIGTAGGTDGSDLDGTIALLRTPLRLGLTQATPDQLASVSLDGRLGSYDLQSQATSSLALIDLSTFRYFITASFSFLAGANGSMTIEAVFLTFAPA